MPRWTKQQLETMCTSKQAYPSLKDATTVKNHRERKGMKKGTLRIYHCPNCKKYHISHKHY